MAKETVYNNTLVSGAADETLTYTRYVKDESSGKSTKELLDEKVNKTDQLGTTQIDNKAVTTEKLADQSVDNSKIAPDAVTCDKIKNGSVIPDKIGEGAVTTKKIETKAVTNEKIGDSAVDGRTIQEGVVQTKHLANESVTNAKIATDSISRDKLEPSIRKELADTISAANAATSKADQATEDAKNATEAATAAKEAADNATQLATNATTASNQATELAKDATTKADDATARANEAAQKADDSREQTEQTLGTMQEVIDKVAIKDDEGTMIETPFRYIQNEEFIFAKVDTNDKLLFGIQWDGTPKFGKTSAVEDRLQSQVTLLAERVATIMGDEDTTNVIDTMNELKKFFAEIENTETLTGILANLDNVAKNLDKTTIKDEEGNVQDTPFRVIENEEFIMAVIDSEDRVLFGFYRATGKPYYPLNEMYHVEQNEEFFALWLDAADHVLLGIRRDGEIIGEIHAVNALKQVISQLQSDLASLQEKVGTIDTNLQELLDVFSLQDNEEYLAVEQDAEGKVLSSTNPDGSHYIHNAKSETIPTEFEHIEDPEGRMQITTDAEDKVMSYRDSQGKKHEHNMEVTNLDVSNLNLQGNSVNNIQDALKANGFDVKTPIDWSEYLSNDGDNPLNIPEPRYAIINISGIDSMPTAKGVNEKAYFEMWDMQGNYFKKKVIVNAQGNTTMYFPKKSFACDFFDNEWNGDSFAIKIGDWVPQDSFHFKAQYTDFFKGISIVAYKLIQEVWASRSSIYSNPWKKALLSNINITSGSWNNNGVNDLSIQKDTGAKCIPDAFPCAVYLNGTFYGVFNWALKKHRDNYHLNKSLATNIHLDGGAYPMFSPLDWSKFEVRNPKGLITKSNETYDGDSPSELIDSTMEGYDASNKKHILSNKVKASIIAFNSYGRTLNSMTKENGGDEFLNEHFDLDNLIDFFVSQYVLADEDIENNWQWVTYDGIKWFVCDYDKDRTFGQTYNCPGVMDASKMINPNKVSNDNYPFMYLYNYHKDDIKKRYNELKTLGIFTPEHIISLVVNWFNRIPAADLKKEYKKWSESPSNRDDNVDREHWKIKEISYGYDSSYKEYDNSKTYQIGEFCIYGKQQKALFECVKETVGNPPITMFYTNIPYDLGYHDSIWRVTKYITERFVNIENELNNI